MKKNKALFLAVLAQVIWGLFGHILEGVGFFTSLSNFSSPHAVVGDFITYTDIFFKGSGL